MERRLVPLTEVQPDPISWVWPNRIALGGFSILEGDPGQAKSLLTYDLVARLTTGREMPNCTGGRPPVGAVLLQAEDHLGTLKANLRAARANPSRIYVFDKLRFTEEPFQLPADLSLVAAAVADVQARLVVLDPLPAFLSASANNDQAVRRAMAPLVAFAERSGVAILGVRHLNKGAAANPLYRGAGSIAFTGIARSVLLAANDPASDDRYRHVLVQSKTNLASAVSLAYRTCPVDGGIAIEWLGETAHTGRDLCGVEGAEQSAVAEAAYVLYSILADGPVQAHEVRRLAAKANVSARTLARAKKVLEVRSKKRGSGRGSSWWWALPEDEARLRPFKEMAMDELMEQLFDDGDDPPLPGDEWKQGQ